MDNLSAPTQRLTELRTQLDAIDDQIHDLFMQRAALVEKVVAEGGKKGTKIRPGREAFILRRLLARHHGAWPAQAIIRIWQEIFVAALTIEGGQTMVVCGGAGKEDRLSLAREYFGPLTPVRWADNPALALADLTSTNGAQLAVLPLFSEDDEAQGSWWTALAKADPALYIIMKLPFWTPRAEGLSTLQAYVVASIPPDSSGHDRGLMILEVPAQTGRADVMQNIAAAGFRPTGLWLKAAPEGAKLLALAEVEELVQPSDPRLAGIAGLTAPPRVVGGYALPITKGPLA